MYKLYNVNYFKLRYSVYTDTSQYNLNKIVGPLFNDENRNHAVAHVDKMMQS